VRNKPDRRVNKRNIYEEFPQNLVWNSSNFIPMNRIRKLKSKKDSSFEFQVRHICLEIISSPLKGEDKGEGKDSFLL
jgi:hypothetical protein